MRRPKNKYLLRSKIRGMIYRTIMRVSHRFNWHYAPPIYPEGDTQLWCKWCGFRQTIKRRSNSALRKIKSGKKAVNGRTYSEDTPKVSQPTGGGLR